MNDTTLVSWPMIRPVVNILRGVITATVVTNQTFIVIKFDNLMYIENNKK